MRKHRVLVAAEAPEERSAAAGHLEAAGYEVVAAVSREDALDVLAREPIDFVVVDARTFEATQRTLAEQREALHRAAHDKRRIGGMIVHDLRSPVAAMLANAELLVQSASADQLEMIEDIIIAAQQIDRTAKDLRDLTRAEAGELSLHRERFRFGELADEVAATMRGPAGWTDLELQLDLPADHVVADRDLIGRMLQNLIHNAVRHAPKRSVVRVDAAVDADGLLVRVIDQGPRVPAADAEHIFDRYARPELDPPRIGSHAFGLAFCRVVAEAHGGRIWVEHAAERGAVFCVRIPQPAKWDGVYDPRAK